MEEWRHSPTILDLSGSFTPWPIYSLGSRPRYKLDRRLCGPQSRSGHCEEEKNLALPGIELRAVQPVTHRYAD
jgi:hypothetical protein